MGLFCIKWELYFLGFIRFFCANCRIKLKNIWYLRVNMNISEEQPGSPCNRHCCLDDKDVCLGCFRHLDEILKWTDADRDTKMQIIYNCQVRKNNSPGYSRD